MNTKTRRQIASQFSFDDWCWLTTQGAFLDAMKTDTPDEITELGQVLLFSRYVATAAKGDA